MIAALCYGAAVQRLAPLILRACIELSRKMRYPSLSCATPYLHPNAYVPPSTLSRVPLAFHLLATGTVACPAPQGLTALTHIEQRRHTLAGLMLREYSFASSPLFHLSPVQTIFRVQRSDIKVAQAKTCTRISSAGWKSIQGHPHAIVVIHHNHIHRVCDLPLLDMRYLLVARLAPL